MTFWHACSRPPVLRRGLHPNLQLQYPPQRSLTNMIDLDRINRFKAMTEADPTNELGFFSLGRAYIDAGQPKDAIPSLQRVLALNPSFSKAYSLLGMAQKASGDQPGAI